MKKENTIASSLLKKRKKKKGGKAWRNKKRPNKATSTDPRNPRAKIRHLEMKKNTKRKVSLSFQNENFRTLSHVLFLYRFRVLVVLLGCSCSAFFIRVLIIY